MEEENKTFDTLADWAKIYEQHVLKQDHMYREWLAESEEEKQLRAIAREYCTACDYYDKTVCTGTSPRTGEPMPIDGREQALINRHSIQKRKEAVAKGWEKGLTEEQIINAIKQYNDRGE